MGSGGGFKLELSSNSGGSAIGSLLPLKSFKLEWPLDFDGFFLGSLGRIKLEVSSNSDDVLSSGTSGCLQLQLESSSRSDVF